jgi:tRNA1Val (adenine37-N6)-methyltransferase
MANDYFAFRQFTVNQGRSAMKVGTDGVLLGAWVNISHAANIIDIGAGTGLVSLMLAQRSGASIDAVEIDPSSASQAAENASISPWADRINIINDSFQKMVSVCRKKYDVAVSNPPFFSNSLKPPDQRRMNAKHTVTLGYPDLFFYTEKILSPEGRLCIIIPSDDSEAAVTEASMNGIYPLAMLMIRPSFSKQVNRHLIEFSRTWEREIVVSELAIKHEGSFTEDYIKLTRDYYLKF